MRKVISDVAPLAPRVTALPTSPVDGAECYFVADAANGCLWHLRYDAASAKWEFLGGSPLRSLQSAGNSNLNQPSDTADATGPSLVIPLAGDYDCELSARCDGPTNIDAQLYTGMGVTSILEGPLSWRAQTGNAGWVEGGKRLRYTGLTKGSTLVWRYYVINGIWRAFERRCALWPVRVS
jgi:hypothetical protein